MSNEDRHRVKITFDAAYDEHWSSGVSVELICPESCHGCKLVEEFRRTGTNAVRGEVTVEADEVIERYEWPESGKSCEYAIARIAAVVETEAARP